MNVVDMSVVDTRAVDTRAGFSKISTGGRKFDLTKPIKTLTKYFQLKFDNIHMHNMITEFNIIKYQVHASSNGYSKNVDDIRENY